MELKGLTLGLKQITYDLINQAKANGGSAVFDCGDPVIAKQVKKQVKEAIKFYSNLDVTIVRDKEVNLYSWTAEELAKDVDSNLIDMRKESNVGGNTRSGSEGNSRNNRISNSDSGRDTEFGF
jgi:RNA-binding protein YhbY